MKLVHEINLIEFIKCAKKCSGDIYFQTDEGDRLNIKSQLSQLVFISAIRSSGLLAKGDITLADEADLTILQAFLQQTEN